MHLFDKKNKTCKKSRYYALFAALSLGAVFLFANCGKDDGTTEYTVTFDENGGSTLGYPHYVKVAEGDVVGDANMPPAPELSGYTFGGWADINGATFTASTTVTKDIRVYARWVTNPDPPPSGEAKSVTLTNCTAEIFDSGVWIDFNSHASITPLMRPFPFVAATEPAVQPDENKEIANKSLYVLNLSTTQETPWKGPNEDTPYWVIVHSETGPRQIFRKQVTVKETDTLISLDCLEGDNDLTKPLEVFIENWDTSKWPLSSEISPYARVALSDENGKLAESEISVRLQKNSGGTFNLYPPYLVAVENGSKKQPLVIWNDSDDYQILFEETNDDGTNVLKSYKYLHSKVIDDYHGLTIDCSTLKESDWVPAN